MWTRWRAAPLLLLLALPDAVAAKPRAAAKDARAHQRTAHESFTIQSAAIAESKLGDTGEVKLHVLLPPSYAKTRERHYPLVLFLPGYNGSPRQVVEWLEAFDRAFAARPGEELVLVAVEGRNVLGGAFYVNSPATGRWEDFVVEEVVRAVEARYRTIPAAASRGLFGFSMGGFGALGIGLRRPDVFGAVFATAPGVFAPGGLAEAMATWAAPPSFKSAYGAAFAPDLAAPRPFARVPDLSSSKDEEVAALWEAGFGGWPARLDAYLGKPNRLARIRLEVGSRDEYAWIVKGTRHLAGLLKQRGLPVEFAEGTFNHDIPMAQLSDSVVPFFQANLAREERGGTP